MDGKPPLYVKLVFWLALGALSVFFAEVVSTSSRFAFVDGWGLLMVFPLYTLHLLILATIVFKLGKPRFYTLLIAGAIFGMYEAYITKVLWSPPWNPEALNILGISVVETALLIFCWHSVMSFIVPLFVGEAALTSSSGIYSGLSKLTKWPLKSKKRALISFAAFMTFFGLLASVNPGSLITPAIAGIIAATVIFTLFLICRALGTQKYAIRDLLPGKAGFAILLALLLSMYLLTGLYLRPEALPGLLPQCIVILIYLVLFALLGLSLRKSKKVFVDDTPAYRLNGWILAALTAIFLSATVIGAALNTLSLIVFVMLWVFGTIVGVLFFARAVIDTVR